MANVKDTAKKGFIARVMDKLTGGDEAKITRFQSKVVKSYNKQIEIRKDEIEDLKDKRNDLLEKYEDTLTNIDLDAIKSAEGLEDYIPRFTNNIMSVKNDIEDLDETIVEKEKQITIFQSFVDDLKA